METVYRTFDGHIFKTAAEAVKYEAKMDDTVKMYNRKGERVYEVDEAYIVYLNWDEETDNDTDEVCHAAVRFMEMAANENSFIDGIEKDSSGWFFWDEWNDEYRWIDDDVIKAFVKIEK